VDNAVNVPAFPATIASSPLGDAALHVLLDEKTVEQAALDLFGNAPQGDRGS
jgi:hypothetical protein